MSSVSAAQGRRKIFFRLGLLALLAVSGFLAVRFTPLGEFMDKDRLLALFEQLRAEWWSPLLLIGLFCVAAPIGLPASPILLAGGMVFGFGLGSLYNMAGLVGGAMISYWVGRALGREAIVQLAGARLRKAEMLFEKRGFWPLVQVRLLPIPFSVVCYAAALAGVPTGRYFVTSLIGIAPATLMHTYFAPKTIHSAIDGEKPIGLLAAYMGCWIGLNLIAGWPQFQEGQRRRRRLAEIRTRRSARPPRA
jgi:phospholipase D1/2